MNPVLDSTIIVNHNAAQLLRGHLDSVLACPKFCIVLAYHHGESFIKAQLESINFSSPLCGHILVGVDNCATPPLATPPGCALGIKVLDAPSRGPAGNFYALLADAAGSDYYAFCDQDDLWLPHKIDRAYSALSKLPASQPALYCSSTLLIDEKDRVIGRSRHMPHPARFANALVQCIAGGNTMVFNAAAREAFLAAGSDMPPAAHDWRMYLTTCACGGTVIYDPEPSVLYRQHGANVMGENRSMRARWRRLRALLDGQFARCISSHLLALDRIGKRMPTEAVTQLAQFRAIRLESNPLLRVVLLWRSGIYRQTALDQTALYLAALFNKL